MLLDTKPLILLKEWGLLIVISDQNCAKYLLEINVIL